MNRLNSTGWFYALLIALTMDIAAGFIIWKDGLNWPNSLFAFMVVICTLATNKFYKEEKN